MKVKFSEHAGDRLSGRSIERKRVLKTVKAPDEIRDSFRGRKLYRKRFGDKILEVVTVNEADNIVIVTQYYPDKDES